MDIASFITSLSIPNFGLNWIDILILIILFFYAIEGFSLGFFAAFIDFFSFILSFFFGLSFYKVLGKVLIGAFSMPQGFANAIGFFLAAVLFEVIFNAILKVVIKNIKLFGQNDSQNYYLKLTNSFFGIIPGILSGLVLCAFVLSLIVALPFSVFLKHSVSEAKIGNFLVSNTQGFASSVNGVFGGAVNDTLSFLTVEPKSDSIVELNFKTTNISVDSASEQEMFTMVNNERSMRGISTLTFSNELTNVGRAHCEDMFKRGYFSHYTPEGLSPFDRMAEANIVFNYAGENLALAPNVDLAMKGLMQSPGHKANILSDNFGKVGIGVIDGGIYGQMYCQEFTN